MSRMAPSGELSDPEVKKGLKLVVAEGLATESMVSFTGGAFLVAMALHMGASNLQLGILAALPTFSSVFQLVSIWLVKRYNNRRAVAVLSNLFARLPLFLIGLLPFLFSGSTSVKVLIFLLFFHYYLGSVAGASWNSWMKDLVPSKQLGSYFSHRSRLTQSLSVILSLALAISLDHVKLNFPQYEMQAYSLMFVVGGLFGMTGVYLLSRTPEPVSTMANEDIFNLLKKPVQDINFRNLLYFNSFWAFSLNLATPFFSVYMMKTLGLPLSYIIALGVLCQLSSIFSIKMWGRYADRYSNKTIIAICAPLYVLCILSWAFVGMAGSLMSTLVVLSIVNILTGISTAGANLAISNISIKLAPKSEAIVYLSVKNMIVAFFSAVAPVIGGLMADFFASHQLVGSFEWKGAGEGFVFNLVHLQGWNFFFIIGGLSALVAIRLLKNVKEAGEVNKDRVVVYMQARFRKNMLRSVKRAGMLSSGNEGLRKRVQKTI